MKEDIKNLVKKQEEYKKEIHIIIQEEIANGVWYENSICERKLLDCLKDTEDRINYIIKKAQKETALAVCDEMIGEEWRIKDDSRYKNLGRSIIKNKGYNQRIKEEKELKKEIIKELL